MYAYDVRPAVKEQVESLGATFIDESTAERDNTETSGGYARAQSEEEQNQTQALLESAVKNSDFVIVLPIYSAGETKIKNLNANRLAVSIQKNSKTKTLAVNNFK